MDEEEEWMKIIKTNRDLRTQENDKSLFYRLLEQQHLSSGIGGLLSSSNEDLNALLLRNQLFSVIFISAVCANKVAVLQVM